MSRERITVEGTLRLRLGVALSPDRAARLLFSTGLATVAFLLLTIPYVPFQDIPNHAQILSIDRAWSEGANPYLRRPEIDSIGYSLYVWISRLTSPLLSVDSALRLMCLVAAIGLPLATARLAGVLGGPAALTGLLALPLGLGWPLRMGFVSFAIGLPCALMGAAHAVLIGRDPPPGRRALIGLGVWGALAYVAHPLAFALLVVLAGLAWICDGARSLRGAAALVAALAPAGLLLVCDVSRGAWLPVVGLAEASAEGGVKFRPIGMSLLHVVSRSYGIAGPTNLALYLPHLVLLVAGAVWLAARGRGAAPRALLLLGGTVFSLGSIAFPEKVGMAVLLGPRTNVLGLCLLAVAAAAFLSRAASRPLLVSVPVTALALWASAVSVTQDARLVEEVVGGRPPRGLAGSFLPVHAADCGRAASYYWGDWDPLRHAWAYALSPEGVTPYLFARHGYDVFEYRVERLVPYPPEGRLLANERALDDVACARRNAGRVDLALAARGYDGVILVGRPAEAESALQDRSAGTRDQIAPGIWRLTP